ncbi:hypothetical protein TNCV_673011 [Trichonephila clavipes]|nr:hypothetical protein TNCV_673011 [Trichonephila clavipes]
MRPDLRPPFTSDFSSTDVIGQHVLAYLSVQRRNCRKWLTLNTESIPWDTIITLMNLRVASSIVVMRV